MLLVRTVLVVALAASLPAAAFAEGETAIRVAPRTGPSRVDAAMRKLGREYRVLRKKKVTPGVFNEELTGSGGRKHKVMAELGRRLGTGGFSTRQLRQVMGAADGVAKPGTLPWINAQPGEDAREIWIYEWRGRHDYLFFEVRDRLVLRADWYAAGD